MFDFKIILLGAVQGLTEFLPVSSSGHLALFQMLFGFSDRNMFCYDIALHMATLFAPLVFFRKDILAFSREWIIGLYKPEYRKRAGWSYGWAVLLGTALTAAIALPMKEHVERAMTSPLAVAGGLFVTSLFLWLTGRLGSSGRQGQAQGQVKLSSGFWVGLIQGAAVMPGISRSGSTIFAGRLTGLSSEEAFRFSFLLSIPVILGAALLEILDMLKLETADLPPYWWVGAILAFVLGMISLAVLRRFVAGGRFFIFSAYCAVLGAVIAALHVLGAAG